MRKELGRFAWVLLAVVFFTGFVFAAPGFARRPVTYTTSATAVETATIDTVVSYSVDGTTITVGFLNRIVLFHEWVPPEEKDHYVGWFTSYGGSVVADLPFINGVILRVPESIPLSELADDARVASVEEGAQTVTLQAVSAAADGGSADGGSTVFIDPVEMIPTEDRPWGTLNLFDHAYDPWALSSVFDYMSVSREILDALFSEHLYAIRVAMFDTGVDTSHRKLRKKIAGGIDLVYGTEGIPADDNGHGTHVAGSLCGTNLGMLLYDPLELYVVKVLDNNAVGEVSSIVMGLQWAIDNHMDIINMSVAYAEESPALRMAVEKTHAAGIVMVAAAGNHSNWDLPAPTAESIVAAADGGSADGGSGDGGAVDDGTVTEPSYPVMFPAAYPEVIAVGAMDSFEEQASFTNMGPEVDFLAPGVDVFSTNLNGGYGICSGSSMATPHISGAVAMMLARARDLGMALSPDDVKHILTQSALNGKISLEGALKEIVYGLR